MLIKGKSIDFENRDLLINIIKNKYHILGSLDNIYSSVFLGDCTNTNIGYSAEFKEEIMIMYDNLDDIIESCNFTQNRKKILRYVYAGLSFEEISILLGKSYSNIQSTFFNIVSKIQKMYVRRKGEV